MSIIDGIIGPVAGLLDKIIPDPRARDAAKLELLRLERGQELELVKAQMAAVLAEAQSPDPWTSRARPSFLYVMYALLLWSIPMGLIAATRPELAAAIAKGMNAYLNGLPEPLYALFGAGYFGYTAARDWGRRRSNSSPSLGRGTAPQVVVEGEGRGRIVRGDPPPPCYAWSPSPCRRGLHRPVAALHRAA